MKKVFNSLILQCAMDDIILASLVREAPVLWAKRMDSVKRWKRFYITRSFE